MVDCDEKIAQPSSTRCHNSGHTPLAIENEESAGGIPSGDQSENGMCNACSIDEPTACPEISNLKQTN